jgi:hypothetical protein
MQKCHQKLSPYKRRRLASLPAKKYCSMRGVQPSPEQNTAHLFAVLHAGDTWAQGELILHNLTYVRQLVDELNPPFSEKDGLLCVGRLKLIEVVKGPLEPWMVGTNPSGHLGTEIRSSLTSMPSPEEINAQLFALLHAGDTWAQGELILQNLTYVSQLVDALDPPDREKDGMLCVGRLKLMEVIKGPLAPWMVGANPSGYLGTEISSSLISPPTSAEITAQLFALWYAGDTWAQTELIRHNLAYVRYLVNKLKPPFDLDDMIGVGRLKLVEVIKGPLAPWMVGPNPSGYLGTEIRNRLFDAQYEDKLIPVPRKTIAAFKDRGEKPPKLKIRQLLSDEQAVDGPPSRRRQRHVSLCEELADDTFSDGALSSGEGSGYRPRIHNLDDSTLFILMDEALTAWHEIRAACQNAEQLAMVEYFVENPNATVNDIDKLAEKLGVSRPTIYRWRNKVEARLLELRDSPPKALPSVGQPWRGLLVSFPEWLAPRSIDFAAPLCVIGEDDGDWWGSKMFRSLVVDAATARQRQPISLIQVKKAA